MAGWATLRSCGRKHVAPFLIVIGFSCASAVSEDWLYYGGDQGGAHHSQLNQINRENVDQLEVAWTHHSGDFSDGSDGTTRTSFNATPILADMAESGADVLELDHPIDIREACRKAHICYIPVP